MNYLVLDGYSGRFYQQVEIDGYTPKRTRIRAIALTRLSGRNRWLQPGQTALVPRQAIVQQITVDETPRKD